MAQRPGTGVGPLRLGQPAHEVVSFVSDLLGPATDVITVEDPILAGCFEGEPGLIGPTLQFTDGLVAEVGRDDGGRYVVQTLNALSPVFCE